MNNVIHYKDYMALVEYDDEEGELYASVVNLPRHGIHVSGKTPTELKKNLREAVKAYEEFCREEGVAPETPYSGRLTYRTTPQQHAALFRAAIASGKRSLNAWIDDVLAKAAQEALR